MEQRHTIESFVATVLVRVALIGSLIGVGFYLGAESDPASCHVEEQRNYTLQTTERVLHCPPGTEYSSVWMQP